MTVLLIVYFFSSAQIVLMTGVLFCFLQVVQDKQLFIFVLFLLMVDILLLTAWQVTDPWFVATNEGFERVIEVIYKLNSLCFYIYTPT